MKRRPAAIHTVSHRESQLQTQFKNICIDQKSFSFKLILVKIVVVVVVAVAGVFLDAHVQIDDDDKHS